MSAGRVVRTLKILLLLQQYAALRSWTGYDHRDGCYAALSGL